MEKKFKKIIQDRDAKNKAAVVELESKHEEEVTTLQNTITTKVLMFCLFPFLYLIGRKSRVKF